MELRSPTLFLIAVLALSGGCSRLGIGARVHDLGDGRFRVSTSQSSDNPDAENAKAARGVCPNGYSVLQKGVSAESLYGSMIQGRDLATSWTIKCAPGTTGG